MTPQGPLWAAVAVSSHRGEAARVILSVADEGELVGVKHHDPPAWCQMGSTSAMWLGLESSPHPSIDRRATHGQEPRRSGLALGSAAAPHCSRAVPAGGGREAVVLLVAVLEPLALATRPRQLRAVEVVELVVAYDADRWARRAAQRRQRRLGGTCMACARRVHGICAACAWHVHGMCAWPCMLAPRAHCRSGRGRR
eukprot:scaffold16475_cov70-Phaeocystis_antarctica.AAC.5